MSMCCSCFHTQTYNIAVEHATKMEISALKCMGAVGGKAGRSALFRAGDVCQMFEHWKNRPPLALRQLANGKVKKEENEIIQCLFVHTHAHSYAYT